MAPLIPLAADLIHQLSLYESTDLQQNAAVRKEALTASRQLSALLQDPIDTAIQLVFSPYAAIVARTAVDLGLFEHISQTTDEISTLELAKKTKGEQLMITRLLRLLAGRGFVREVAQDRWAATAVTTAMATPAIAAGYRFVWDILMTSAAQAPKFLRETGHRCPTEPTDGFIQYAQQTKMPVFEYLVTHPDRLHDFNSFMGHTMGAKKYWVDWYPIEERLLKGASPKSALLVDIGGGRGHDLQAFCARFPKCGHLVLQDLPQGLAAIQDGELDPSIECMEYDFFTEQPVKGARVYFMHHILHDWSDSYCVKILSQIRTAMTPGYSKLLLHDLVLPDTGANPYQTTWDITMMTFNGGIERSRTQWTELLVQAGFAITKFWIDDEDADGIVEAEVATNVRK